MYSCSDTFYSNLHIKGLIAEMTAITVVCKCKQFHYSSIHELDSMLAQCKKEGRPLRKKFKQSL